MIVELLFFFTAFFVMFFLAKSFGRWLGKIIDKTTRR